MYYTIYKTTNKINGKFYIGKHQTENINDNYFGSGKALKEAIKIYGKDNFTKEILFVFDNEKEMNNKEREIINEELVSSKLTYNIGIGGEGGSHFKGKKHSDKTKEKLSLIGKSKKVSIDTKKKISEAGRKRVLSDETKKKISDKAKQRMLSDESRNKISNTLKRKYKNGEISKESIIYERTSDHKKKMSEIMKKIYCGVEK